jgi:DNA polymerase V
MIACTRSFGQAVSDLEPLIEAVSEFATRAAQKLRRQQGRAARIQVFAHTSPHRLGPRFSRSVVIPLGHPTDDTRLLVAAAIAGLRSIYQSGFALIKAGVILLDLMGPEVQQAELDFAAKPHPRDQARLMSALDAINGRYGKGAIHVGSTGQEKPERQWAMRQLRRTPHYTTSLDDVPLVRA